MLERKKNESVFITNENDTKMWDVKKLYTQTTFPDDDTSLDMLLMFIKNLLTKHLQNIL